jgi:hypothetical protein
MGGRRARSPSAVRAPKLAVHGPDHRPGAGPGVVCPLMVPGGDLARGTHGPRENSVPMQDSGDAL